MCLLHAQGFPPHSTLQLKLLSHADSTQCHVYTCQLRQASSQPESAGPPQPQPVADPSQQRSQLDAATHQPATAQSQMEELRALLAVASGEQPFLGGVAQPKAVLCHVMFCCCVLVSFKGSSSSSHEEQQPNRHTCQCMLHTTSAPGATLSHHACVVRASHVLCAGLHLLPLQARLHPPPASSRRQTLGRHSSREASCWSACCRRPHSRPPS